LVGCHAFYSILNFEPHCLPQSTKTQVHELEKKILFSSAFSLPPLNFGIRIRYRIHVSHLILGAWKIAQKPLFVCPLPPGEALACLPMHTICFGKKWRDDPFNSLSNWEKKIVPSCRLTLTVLKHINNYSSHNKFTWKKLPPGRISPMRCHVSGRGHVTSRICRLQTQEHFTFQRENAQFHFFKCNWVSTRYHKRKCYIYIYISLLPLLLQMHYLTPMV
jgi:hypothetical protein